ncbi:MAG TPA: hypothetical protein VKE93_01430 [Candidatus Angelobacter sp.]|nr:hypothetical protein [Candidatus Angelobacter sp.]
MKALSAMTFVLAVVLASAAQSTPEPAVNSGVNSGVDSVLAKIQQTAKSTDADLVQLRIDKWKTDPENRAQLQQVSTSLHKNLTLAVPDLLHQVESGKGSVSATFKLYHNLNIVYEYLSSLADAATALGRKEEADSLNHDAAALDSARQELSTYIEQAAVALEVKAKPTPTPTPAPVATPKKIVIDDEPKKSATPKKKRTSTPTPQPTPTPR